MTLEESLAEITDMLFNEDLLRVALCHICGSIFFTADESESCCARCAPANHQPSHNHADGNLSPFVLIHPERPVAPSWKGYLLNTQTKQPLTGHRSGYEYRVTTDESELPRGSRVVVLPGVPVKRGDLALFEVNDRTMIGRWLPDFLSFDWVVQPNRAVYITETCPVRIVGPIVTIPPLDICATGQIKASPGSCN